MEGNWKLSCVYDGGLKCSNCDESVDFCDICKARFERDDDIFCGYKSQEESGHKDHICHDCREFL